MDTETRLLHESLLRLLKGMIRAYERWVNVRVGKEPPSIELPKAERPDWQQATGYQPIGLPRSGEKP